MPPSDFLELVALAGQLEHFLLGQAGGVARQLLLEALEALDRVGNGLPVGQHAAEPAMVDEMLAARRGRIGDRVLRLALGADEQHLAAAGDRCLDEVQSAGEQRNGLRQIDDVNAVAVAENIRLHPRVPAVGLVAEVCAGLKQLLHRDDSGRHRKFSFRLCLCGSCNQPEGRHRYDGSACGMAAPLAEAAAGFKRWRPPHRALA